MLAAITPNNSRHEDDEEPEEAAEHMPVRGQQHNPVPLTILGLLEARLIRADVVVLAGKGHEDYQEIDGERHDFSDLVEADHALTAWEVAHA